MAYEQLDNSGTLFVNNKKREGKQDADYTGSVKVDGKEYWLNGWKKEKDGNVRLSLSFRPKVQSENKPRQSIPWEDDDNLAF